MGAVLRHGMIWVLLSVCLPFGLSAQLSCGLAWHQVYIPGSLPVSPDLLLGQASAFDSRRGVAVLFGGNNPVTGVLHTGDTWEWNRTAWANRKPLVHPSARKNAAMAYDSDRGVCVLFGGGTNIFQHEIPFNDTWEWDGTVWTLRRSNDPSGGNRPPPMDTPIMAYDSFRKRTVLIGSAERAGSEINPVTRTWEWDGEVWTVHDRLTSASPAPPPRIQSAMAYDPVRRVTVVFGGTAFRGGLLHDTWVWDGANWTQVGKNTFPAARDQHSMAFDLRRQVMVLFGGSDGDILNLPEGTFEWDGTSWSPSPSVVYGLPPRRLHLMWYENDEQRLIVFGGIVSSQSPGGPFQHKILDEMREARPPGRWVDFNYPGQPSLAPPGNFYTPFNTLAAAVASAAPGCTLILKPGSLAETITISKPLTLEAYRGPATVGRASP